MTLLRIPYCQISTSQLPFQKHKNLPFLKVGLQNHNSQAVKLVAFIDTGAQWCLFSKSYAKILGIHDYKSGVPILISGIGGNVPQNTAYFHDLTLAIFNDQKHPNYKDAVKIDTKVGFLEKDIGVAGILGVYGFLDHFKFIANIPQQYFEIEYLF
ncbi:MAG: hypothetical protein A2787_04850 [Omnitrophica WOR_2 bacterium RIFCSPHIGHO2_01_FULL_48_9]|nr:MAG: hypothetical protein A3D10_03290 [Omnitrophica WOR_2 bacterium RIFCSPHIGHO2_02_FULL_48_11]OGX32747.1 MAG: hypothetical protein A2787_04850 [Omnitrophica WOR_2 bacterium RIFCSPHIGHO2_01_FULL_48_9]